MCGISGVLDFGITGEKIESIANGMNRALVHRGPDSSGVWSEPGVGLAHRRLKIIDLSVAADQPMLSSCGRYVVVFNGEIYNYLPLRRELGESGYCFKTKSDTEVILAAVKKWGVLNASKRFTGMFAFALWDTCRKELTLVRDPLGIKPLYYGWVGENCLLFSSELKAFRAHPEFRPEVAPDSLALFVRYNYVPAPFSIYKKVFKLLPGTVLTFSKKEIEGGTLPQNLPLESKVFWNPLEVAQKGTASPLRMKEQEIIDSLDKLIKESVKMHTISDVPIGAFLSGGIDSSLIVAMLQGQTSSSVNTFCIGFDEKGYNEAVFAKEIAKYLGTNHTELYVTSREALSVIPLLSDIYDEPFADSSQIPTFIVSQLAKKEVKVCLSGDGGDELFSGYDRYAWGKTLWRRTGWMSGSLKKQLGGLGRSIPIEAWDSAFRLLSPFVPPRYTFEMPGDKIHKLCDVVFANSIENTYNNLVSLWKEPEKVVRGALDIQSVQGAVRSVEAISDPIHKMMFLDLIMNLPNDILTKVDRASMAVSLEVRVPLLNHKIVEFAWHIPLSLNRKNGEGKWLIRQILSRYLPVSLFDRPKMGFAVPLASWLRGPLREWAEELLSARTLEESGYLYPEPIRTKWEEHLSGKRDWKFYLWNILMFQAWAEKGT